MPRVLISFCNQQRSSDQGVLLYDTVSERGEWVRVSKNERTILGSYGIFVAERTVYVLYCIDRDTTRLAVLRRDSFALIRDRALPETKDPHSLALHEGSLFVTSTGTDQLLAYAVRRGIVDGHSTVVWGASDAGVDSHHINSVVVHQGQLYVSAFGVRSSEYWRSARNGYIYNVTKGRIEAGNIYHPHSLVSFADDLYFVESSLQSLRSLRGQKVSVPGYLRGCAMDAADGSMWVGSNGGRAASRSTGVMHSSGDPANAQESSAAGACALEHVTLGEVPHRRRFDLAQYGREVYDVRIV